MKLFLPNLNFEDQLSGRTDQPSEQTSRAIDDLAPLMGLLGVAGDVVLAGSPADAAELPACLGHITLQMAAALTGLSGCEVVPWGWTPAARRVALDFGMPAQRVPPLEAVRAVNSRAFSAKFDQVVCEDPQSLPFGVGGFGVLCRNIEQWQASVKILLESGYPRWVAKPQFSHAGRNRLLATGPDINQQQYGWLRRQLDHADGVYVEPWLEPIDEAGLQFRVPPPHNVRSADAAGTEFLGVTELLTDHVGRYLGSVIHSDPTLQDQWQPAVRHGRSICQAAAARGYFGPVGIDCFRFRTPDGSVAIRLCNDINARYTMGRLALELRSLLRPEQSGVWCRFAAPRFADFLDSMRKILRLPEFHDVCATVTSPESLAGRPVAMGTVLLGERT